MRGMGERKMHLWRSEMEKIIDAAIAGAGRLETFEKCPRIVIPAKAGIQKVLKEWIPASTGMTIYQISGEIQMSRRVVP